MKYLVTLIILVLLATNNTSTTAYAKNNDLICLAQNIYFEARGEPFKGKVAVAQVTLNRVNHDNYADTVCGVVYQPNQFSWTKSYSRIVDKQAWAHAKEVAHMVMQGDIHLPNFNALHFHSKKIKPKWAYKKTPVLKVGNHVFY